MQSKKILSYNDVFGIVFIFLIALVSESGIMPNTFLQKLLWCFLAGIGVVIILKNRFSSECNLYLLSAFFIPLPFILANFYTIILVNWGNDEMGIVSQSISTTVYIIVDMLMVLALCFLYKQKCVDVIYASILLSYAFTLVRALYLGGFGRFIKYLIQRSSYPDWYFSSFYERHDVGVACMPVLFYYLYRYLFHDKNKKYLLRCFFMLAVMLMCGKRSAYLSFAVAVIILFVYKVTARNIKVSYILLLLAFAVTFLYISIIHSGLLSLLCDFLNVNTMGRLAVYSWFDTQYEVSPFYLGKGFQYVHCYMQQGSGSQLVNLFDYLHNSSLQIYIETGFWGFLIWFGILLYFFPMFVKKHFGKEVYLFLVLLTICMTATFTVDNVLTYPLFQISMYTVLFGFSKTCVFEGMGKLRGYKNE